MLRWIGHGSQPQADLDSNTHTWRNRVIKCILCAMYYAQRYGGAVIARSPREEKSPRRPRAHGGLLERGCSGGR